MKKNRYSFKIVCLWVALINGGASALTLVMIYYVKLPYQTINTATFNLTRWMIRLLAGMVIQILVDYIALNWYYRLMSRKASWKKYLLPSLALMSIAGVFYFVNDLTIKKEEFNVALDISVKLFSYGISAIFQIVVPLIIAAITRHLDERKWQAQNQKMLEQRTFQLEKEKMQADYLFLKAQINPHFLHNTLNFLYSRALPHSPELSEGILTLSEIMRYSLDKEEDADGKVLLTREIEHVHHVIRIQQLRFGNDLQANFIVRGEPAGHLILPFILITLVENAFKHGDLKSPDHPIQLELDIRPEGRLFFYCSNKKRTGPRELSTGIGLDNTRKRLELTYGENYSLYIKDQKELFTAHLIITL